MGRVCFPTPVELIEGDRKCECIVSWAPAGKIYSRLSGALYSPEAIQKRLDLVSQAKYYLECTLARLHRVRFGPDDWIEDKAYERQHEFLQLGKSLEKLERLRIAKLGSLDRFSLTPSR